MTKKEIVHKISERLNVSQRLVHEVVQQVFDEIVESLVTDQRIELRNFGVFDVRVRKPRKARNPRTSESFDLPQRLVVNFKPGKIMVQRVQTIPVPAVQPDRALAAVAEGEESGAGSF